MNRYHYLGLLFFLLTVGSLPAQTHSTAYMQGRGTGFVSLNLDQRTAGQFFVGPNLIDRLVVFDKTAQTAINLQGIYGISDRLDISASFTKATARGVGNRQFLDELGISSIEAGFQDLGIMANYLVSETSFDQGSLRVNGLAEVILPIGNYSVGEGFQSLVAIGNNSYGIGAGMVTLFQFFSDFYISMENRVTINSGPMPNVFQNHFFAGYMNKNIILEFFTRNHFALSGPETFGLGFEGIFPYSNIQQNSLGLYLCKPIGSGVVMTSRIETIVHGRNTPKHTWISLGLGYVFGENKMRLNHY